MLKATGFAGGCGAGGVLFLIGTLAGGVALPLALPAAASTVAGAPLTIGVRASALRVRGRDGDAALPGKVELAEISGSDTFVHVDTRVGELIAQLTGVHQLTLGAPVCLYLNPARVHVFDGDGDLLVAPTAGVR